MPGQTIAEKILADAAGRDRVSPGDHVVCDVDLAMANDLSLYSIVNELDDHDIEEVWDPSSIVCVMDHQAPSLGVEKSNADNVCREFVRDQEIETFYDVGNGIAHEVLPERGHVRPGELVVGGDSHTPSYGVFGVAATGMGPIDMAYVFATGQNWFRVPETIKFEIAGEFGHRVSAKDLVLHIAGEFGTDVGRYKAIEYKGPAIEALHIDDRFILSNMGIELGAKFAFGPVDDAVLNYVDERTDESYEPRHSDNDAEYHETYHIDADDLEPTVSKPHLVQNAVPVGEVEGTELDQVFIGSCTNGKFQDLKYAAEILEGNEVASGTRMIVTPASREIYRRAEDAGIIRTLNDAGAVTTHATCGACVGMGPGVLGDGEVCFAAQNRNFQGRMGSDDAEIYLGSPETAAASAIEGAIADPREV